MMAAVVAMVAAATMTMMIVLGDVV